MKYIVLHIYMENLEEPRIYTVNLNICVDEVIDYIVLHIYIEKLDEPEYTPWIWITDHRSLLTDNW